MRGLDSFIREHAFASEGGCYYGTYNDMHMVLREAGGALDAYLYMDLPASGKKSYRELMNALNEKAGRYGAAVSACERSDFLKITFSVDPVSDMERYLTECDVALRPFTREMGILCAYCKKELGEEKPVYRMADGMVVPVCQACSGLENPQKVKKASNRREMAKKNARRGALGLALGALISAAIWFAVETATVVFAVEIIAVLCPFLIKFLFERFGGYAHRSMVILIAAVSILAMVAGTAAGTCVTVNRLSILRNTEAYVTAEEGDSPDWYSWYSEEFGSLSAVLTSSMFYKGLAEPAVFSVIGSLLACEAVRFRRRR